MARPRLEHSPMIGQYVTLKEWRGDGNWVPGIHDIRQGDHGVGLYIFIPLGAFHFFTNEKMFREWVSRESDDTKWIPICRS